MAVESELRVALKEIIEKAFKAEKFPVKSDKLHGSIGANGTTIGIYPAQTVPWQRDINILEPEVCVQFYGKYDLEANPLQEVDPTIIEDYAERFRDACRENAGPQNSKCWFYEITRLEYPDDPTENKSRFEAKVKAYGTNTALVESGE